MKITPRNPDYSGIFIAVEGIDGCGKTTAVKHLESIIRENFPDRELVVFRAPGGTPVGEKIRNILLHEEMGHCTELLLFLASHNETIEKVIIPALKRGAIVLTDRFLDSAYAYQGYGRDLLPQVHVIHTSALQAFEPDHVIYILADQDVTNQRLDSRGDQNRLDVLDGLVKQRIRDGMADRQMLRQNDNPERVSVIENNGTEDQLNSHCCAWVSKYLLG
jgi:dTMP kinase